MKKILSLLLAAMLALSLIACSAAGSTDSTSTDSAENTSDASTTDDTQSDAASADDTLGDVDKDTEEDTPESVTITSLDGTGTEVELEVPYNPERIAVMDLAVLDILDNLGLGERIVGVSKGSSIDYLQSYVSDDNLVNLGTIKEADLEAVMACEPDVIFIGGRLSASYDALSEIAPVVYLSTDISIGLVESVRNNATTIASIFGLESEVEALMDGFDARISTLAEFAAGKTAIVGMCTSGSFNVLGNDGRCSIIGVEIGFENIGVDADVDTATHGNEASFEFIVDKNPDYIFVMDRDAAIGTDGAQLAQEIMENELVMETDAYQNGHLIYLEHSAVWYTAEGGITALDVMLSDLESALLS